MGLFIAIAILLFVGMIAIDYFFQPKKKNHIQSFEKQPEKSTNCESVLGKSSFDQRQSTPNDATPKESPKNIENNTKEGNNFEESNQEEEEYYDPEPMDIDVPPLERIDPSEQENTDEEEEIIELFGSDAFVASGLTVNEMLQTNQTIDNPNATAKEEENAGRVLYENKKTDMFEQMVSGNPVRIERIRNLMYIHEKLHGITEEINESSIMMGQNSDIKNFDVSKYVR